MSPADQLVQEGVQHDLQGRLNEALACASAALPRNSQSADAHQLIGAQAWQRRANPDKDR